MVLFSITCLASKAAENVAAQASNGGTSYFTSIGSYFSVPQSDINVVRHRGIPEEEVPVVFFLSRQAKVAPSTIINLRRKGVSWLEITQRFGYGPEIFYVAVDANVVADPPYRRVYEDYNSKPMKQWSEVTLRDNDIINLVNLKYISEYYKYPPEPIMTMRHDNKGFAAISDEIVNQQNPDHATGTKKQLGKAKQFLKKI